MARDLLTVQKGEPITAEKWNALVERVNELSRPAYTFAVPVKRLARQSEGECDCPNYVAGLGIDIGAESAQLGGRPITNTGVLSVRISGSSYTVKGEPLNLAASHFMWRVSTGSGEYEAWIKTHRESVVTDIQNGVPVKKTIEVIGAE